MQGALAAILSIFLGQLAQNFGLRPVMLWLVTIPYAINAISQDAPLSDASHSTA